MRNPLNRFQVWSTVALFFCSSWVVALPVAGEWYVGGFAGGAFPEETDATVPISTTTVEQAGRSFQEIQASNLDLDASPVAGVKAGYCPEVFAYLCAEVEFDAFFPDLDRQSAGNPQFGAGPFTSVEDFLNSASFPPGTEVPQFDFDVFNLALNLVGRVPFFEAPAYPLGGRLHLYGGGGPAFIWTKATNEDCVGQDVAFTAQPAQGGVIVKPLGVINCGEQDTDFAVGAEAIGGIKYFITRHLAVFAEYKYLHWESNFTFPRSFSPVSGVSPTAVSTEPDIRLSDVDFNVHLAYVGLGFHF